MLKMNATPGGGYWLEVEGNRFEVVLDTSEVEGVYGGRMIKNRQYYCVVNGKRLGGGPYDRAVYAKDRLEPIVDRVRARAALDRERDAMREMAAKLFPGGLPDVVTEAIDKYPEQTGQPEPDPDPVATEVEETEAATEEETAEPEPDPVPVKEPEQEKEPEPTPAETAAAVRKSAPPTKRRTGKATTTTAKTTKGTAEKATTPRRRRSTKAAENGTAEKVETTETTEAVPAAK